MSASRTGAGAAVPWLDVLIVGAGPAGIGMALALQPLEAAHPQLRVAVLEANRIGESFHRWPAQTRFITPSFHSNPFGLADLNAVNASSSPAIHAGAEHLSGTQYARYLAFVAHAHALPIAAGCKVRQVQPLAARAGFKVLTEHGDLHTRLLVWATGEYQFPALAAFPGAEHCTHYAQVLSWDGFDAPAYTVIGGYESGVDAAVNLVRRGCQVRLLVRKSTWDPEGPYDPSLSLSPYSRERLYQAMDSQRLEIVFGADVVEVQRGSAGHWRIQAADGRDWEAAQPPILGTGFLKGGGATQIASLWDWNAEGRIVLNAHDESTRTPGLFLVGPQVRHDERIYCFIYKFRQRFGVIANEIARHLQLDAAALQQAGGAWGPFGNSDCCEGCEC